MGQPVRLTVDAGLATFRLEREHGNAINDELVQGLMTACQEVEADPAVRGVLLTAAGKLFCPGLDLQELVELDRATMMRFLHRFNACILMLYTLSKPMVAALHGHTIAGGCVLALTSDWRVLAQGAMIGLNEVKVGVPFPFGVSMVMRESVPRACLEEVALFGRNYEGDDALRSGLAHEIRPTEGFVDHCRARLQELADKDPRAFATTKRYLRSATVERIRANDEQFAEEFLDSWFSEETRGKIRMIVAGLKSSS